MMKKLFTHLPWWVLGLLIVLVILIEGPLIAFPFYAGDEYQGINIAHFGNDEHHYLSRAREALDGHGMGQTYLAEWKEKPDAFQSNVEQVLMLPLRALGLGSHIDITVLYNSMHAIGLMLLLVLIYVLVYAMTGDALLAATCALFSIGGYALVEYKTVLFRFLTGRELIYSNFNVFGRSIFPYIALVPFYGFLILTYRAAMSRFQKYSREHSRPYLYVLGAGALFGLLFYDYFYAWSFALGFLGSLTIGALLWRKWHAALAATAIGAIGVHLGSYKLYSLYQLYTSPLGEQLSYFFMALKDHSFIMSNTSLAVAVLFALYAYTRRDDSNNFFLFSLIGAGWVALEQQMITGHAVQYGHYYWYFVSPISIIVAVYMVVRIVPLRAKWWRAFVCVGLIMLALVNTAAGQYRSFWTTASWKMREQQFAPLMQKLQSLPYGVVLGDPGGASYPLLTTIYTDHDLYWIPAAITCAFPIDHLREALLAYMYINKESRKDPARYLETTLASPTPNAYTEMYEELEGITTGTPLQLYRTGSFPRTDPTILAVRESFRSEIGKEYKDMLTFPGGVRAALLLRNVRYILWDKQQYPEWDLTALLPLSLLATSTDLELYELR